MARSTNGNTAAPVDEAGLIAFPGLNSNVPTSGGETPDELNCTQDLGTGDTSDTSSANFQIVPFSSDFRVSDAATSDPLATLNTTSDLVRSVYWPGDSCPNGGYPIPTTGSSTSIAGGGSGDSTSASNPAAGIAGGAGSSSSSTQSVNGGIAQGSSTTATNTSTIVAGNSSSNLSTALTIGGGPNSASAGDRSEVTGSGTSTSIGMPANTVAGDFLLVTVTGQGAGLTGSSTICAPNSNWSLADKQLSATGGTPVIQATYSGLRTAVGAGPYTFSFFTGACNSTALTLATSAVALRYTNVAGVDAAAGAVGNATNTDLSGSAPGTTWGTTAEYVSLSAACASVTAATCTTTPSTAGTVTSATLTFSAAIGSGDSYTVNLLKNGGSVASCTVASGASGCPMSGLSVAVNGTSDTLVLQVTQAGGTTGFSGTVTTAAVEAITTPTNFSAGPTASTAFGTGTEYVSLGAPTCVSATVATCDTATVAAAGTITSWTLTLSANVTGNGQSYTVTFYKNGSATTPASTCNIPKNSNSCTITPSIAVAAGDVLELAIARSTSSQTLTATTAAVETVPSNTNLSGSGSTSTTTWGTTNEYVSLAAACLSSSSTGCTTILAAGTVTSASFTFGAATGSGQSYAVNLLKNGTSAGSCTIAAATSTCTISSLSVAVNGSSDTLELEVAKTAGATNFVGTATSAAVDVVGGVTMTAPSVTTSQANEQVVSLFGTGAATTANLAGSAVSTAFANSVRYVSLNASCTSTTITTCDTATAASAGTITSAAFTFAAAVSGTGSPSYTITLYQNAAAAPGASCTIASGASSCTINPSLNVAAGDKLEFAVLRNTSTQTMAVTATAAVEETSFTTASALPFTVSGTSTGTAADDTSQATAGASATESVASVSADNWVAETVALTPAPPSSISASAPSGYVAGDLLLVTVAANGLGSGVICAPGVAWTPVATTTTGSGATQVTQESFWTTSGSPGYTFNLDTACSGTVTPIQAGASVVAVSYSGVDTTTPLDGVTATSASGSASPLAPAAITPNSSNDEVVSLFATDATALTLTGSGGGTVQNSVWTSSGIYSQQQVNPVSVTPANGTSVPASANWSEQTVALQPALTSSIAVTAPSGYSANSGDVLLVSLAVQKLGTNTICAPSSEWTAIPVSGTVATVSSGTLTQETFWTTASSAYSFSFYPSSSCTGTAVKLAASAVATTYTGVDVATEPTATSATGSTSLLTAPQNATANDEEEVVSMFATNDSFSGTVPSQHTTSGWADVGEDAALQPVAGNQSVQATAGSSVAASWTAETVDLTPLLSPSITVTPPSGYVGGGGDFMLVSVAVQDLGSGSICAPDTSWAPLPVSPGVYTKTSGTLTQEAFYTTTSSASSDIFSFYKSSACSGTAVDAGATAEALNYTGVNPVTPIDGSVVSSSGTSSPLVPAQITTSLASDDVVTLYASGAASLSGPTLATTGTGFTSSGASNSVQAAGAYTAANATSAPSASNWTTETVALRALSNQGITIARPSSPTGNDFLIVTVTASGLASGASICAPNDGTWTELGGATVTSGVLTQASFYSTRPGTNAESYSFNFQSGACPSGGSPTGASATAVAVRFTGVNPITPIDYNSAGTALEYASAPPPTHAAGTTVSPPAVTPTHAGDELVGLYGTAATTMTGGSIIRVGGGSASASGFSAVNEGASAGSSKTPATATTASKDWIGQTIALEGAYGACGSSCEYGVEDPGGQGTDYGLAIRQAQTNLVNLTTATPSRATAQNVIILLSDGDANTSDGLTSNPCEFGIDQAEAAEAAGTWVFTIAYGALYNQSSGGSCTGDIYPTQANYITGVGGSSSGLGLSAQCAMILMAHNHVTDTSYGTDAAAKSALCPSNTYEASDPGHKFYNQATNTSLAGVFQQIGVALTSPRLLSPNAS